MSRGLGRVQRRILAILGDLGPSSQTHPEALDLADLCRGVNGVTGEIAGHSPEYSAVARAVRELADKGLVRSFKTLRNGHIVTLVMRPTLSCFDVGETLNREAFQDGAMLQGDCRQLLPGVPDCSVAMAYLDPPYNLQLSPSRSIRASSGGYGYGQVVDWDGFESLEAYDEPLQPVLEHLLRVLRPDGSLWVSGSYHCIHRLGNYLQDLGAWFFSEIVWWRPNARPPFPLNKRPQLLETLLWVAKDRQGASLLQKRYDHDLMVEFATVGFKRRQPLSMWSIPVCRSPERLRNADRSAGHPTQKPLELRRRMILLSTRPGELVLNPMAGTGTTGSAAGKLERQFLLMEREPQYVRAAEKRLRAADLSLSVIAPPSVGEVEPQAP